MRTPSQRELLDLWAGMERHPARLALGLLSLTADEGDSDPARLPPGRRDALLLEVHERLFGPEIAAAVSCANCGQEQELELHTGDIRSNPASGPAEVSVAVDGYSVQCRLPNSADLEAITAESDAEADLRTALLARCVLEAKSGDIAVSATDLPAHVVDAISERMSEADPQAEVELAIECPECHHVSRELFDIVPFLAAEIHAWAVRTMRDIHHLAAAYGWSESEVLAVGPRRRAFYLDLIAS
jgi:hypothetical protein